MSFYYAQLDENNICRGVSSLSGEITQGNMIRLESYNIDLMQSHYENKTFIGYETRLTYENGVATATVYDWLTDSILIGFSENIIFDCEGVQEAIQAVNGVATIDVTVEAGTQITVRTANGNFKNGEVIING